MSEQGTIIEIGSHLWPRYIAIQEAGHAIAAWFLGCDQVEIALANKQRIAKTSMAGDVDDCKAVAVYALSYPQRVTDMKPHHLSTDYSIECLIEQTCKGLIISLSGVVAQSQYTGEDIGELMQTSGKQDMQTVRDLVAVYKDAGGDDEDIQHKSLSRARALITLKWWDAIALAKILENRNHMPVSNFQNIMGNIDNPVPKVLTLSELDDLVNSNHNQHRAI
ncbi:hypothetical protein ACRQTN_14410 [Pectobacterium brasiliense]|uniref:hypothetical protein n=1 Tax=Pectobacterium brasiliense TaxID=180957 RepID=UPI003EBF837B